jgi:hypothetical protein
MATWKAEPDSTPSAVRKPLHAFAIHHSHATRSRGNRVDLAGEIEILLRKTACIMRAEG